MKHASRPGGLLPERRAASGQGPWRGRLRHRVRLHAESGPDAGHVFEVAQARVSIGSAPVNDVVLSDGAVSARHAALELTERGVLLRDLGSAEGTWVGACWLRQGYLDWGSAFRVGETRLRLEAGPEYEVPLAAPGTASIVGESLALREAVGALERAARSDGPVLLQGETGVGKERFARALHALSARRDQPFEVLDCASVSPTLMEAHVYGHARGAFTGAVEATPGIIELADGGTLFIDEVGELPLDLQPRLLRVLEERAVRRLGESRPRPVDVRFVAATHRNLRALVDRGEFRADLLYRLEVLPVTVPPLRERKEDIPLLAQDMLRAHGVVGELDAQSIALLQSHDWPGNLRELKNVLVRAVAFAGGDALRPLHLLLQPTTPPDAPLPAYHVAKEQVLEAFERSYLTQLLARHGGSIQKAADAAGLPRQTLRRIIVRCGLAEREG